MAIKTKFQQGELLFTPTTRTQKLSKTFRFWTVKKYFAGQYDVENDALPVEITATRKQVIAAYYATSEDTAREIMQLGNYLGRSRSA